MDNGFVNITIDLSLTVEEAVQMRNVLNEEINRVTRENAQTILRTIEDPEEAVEACKEAIRLLDMTNWASGDPYNGRYV